MTTDERPETPADASAEPGTTNYAKYHTKNPLARKIIERFLEAIGSRVAKLEPSQVIDLGCGEGIVAARIHDLGLAPFEYRGLDLTPEAVEAARGLRPDLDFQVADIIATEPEPGWADVALCLEVLEHLDDPSPAVERIAAWTRRAAIISVPWEPHFRIGNFFRGKYLGTWGNHPEHVQQFRPRSLGRLLRETFPRVEVGTCWPWIVAVAWKDD